MLVVLRVFGLLVRDNRCWRWLFHRVSERGPWVGETLRRVWVLVSWGVCVWSLDLSRWGLGRSFAPAVFTVSGRWRATGALVAALPAVLPAALPAVLPAASVAALPAVL